MMNGTSIKPRECLSVRRASRDPEDEQTVRLVLDGAPTDDEVRQFAEFPPAPEIARDLGDMVKRAMTLEIVARLCRAYVLSGIALPDGPRVTRWLRDYVDGTKAGLGPLGAPLPWPDELPGAASLLRTWGFSRSPNGWVARGGTHSAPPEVRPS